jgi:imidazole glycerol-phosphate synthase subunit HisH
MIDVAIIDYNMGNLRSIKSACEYVDLKSIITKNHKDIMLAKSIILPGVGSFDQAIKNIKKNKLDSVIKNFYYSKKMIIGICLGMQLLFDESNENKKTKGLGLIKGKVDLIKKNNDYQNFNIGWKSIRLDKKMNSLINLKLNNKKFYFIHKYVCNPDNKKLIVAKSEYKKTNFCAAIKSKNIEAYQFHPEKSGVDGLSIYANLKKKLYNENFI